MTTQLSLRILYTINSSPQYILARSPSQVPVSPIPSGALQSDFHYAAVSLKICLDTICCSSPELVQDFSRDFSVYVLDPLESSSSQVPVNILHSSLDSSSSKSNTTPEPSRGVAVGLGLMSWALRSDEKESCTVTGTLIKLSTGQTALEVIFALRETATMQKASLPATLRSWGLPSGTATCTASGSSRGGLSSSPQYHQRPTDSETRATLASIQMRGQQKRLKSKKLARPPLTTDPNSEADRLMLAQDIYIGPVKKKGRPVRLSNTSNSQPSDRSAQTKGKSSTNPSGYSSLVPKPQTRKGEPEVASTSHLVTPNPDSVLDILACISATTSSEISTTALLTAFNAIDSSSTTLNCMAADKPPNPALVNALQDFLAAIAQQGASAPNESRNSAPQIHSSRKSQSFDDEIVLLDKENINPSAFRRRGDGNCTKSSPAGDKLGSLTSALLKAERVSRHYTNANPTEQPANKACTRSSRKRTLSDFMDEMEAERNKGKGKTKEKSEELDENRYEHSTGSSSGDALTHRHYPRVITSDYPRKRTGTNSYYRTAVEPWTSPIKPTGYHVRSPSTQQRPTHENSRARPAILPGSPQTCRATASSPARSKPSQPRKPYVVPAWARTDTTTQARLSQEAQRAAEESEKKKTKENDAGKESGTRIERTRYAKKKTRKVATAPHPPQPVAAMNDRPIFAVTACTEDQTPSSMPSTPRHSPVPWPITAPMNVFCTPPKKHSTELFTPVGDASLFTPLRSSPSGSTANQMSFQTDGQSASSYDDAKPGGNDLDVEDDLSRELDSALEELDVRSGSLPTADSDVEVHGLMLSPHHPSDEYGSECEVEPAVKQHWDGLPPSSPPPPSSPVLMPQEGSDLEDLELPIATSEAEDGTPDSEHDIPPSPSIPSLPSCTEEEIAEFLSNSEFDLLFPDIGGKDNHSTSQMMDIFHPFPEYGVDARSGGGLDTVQADAFQTGLSELDTAEFWEIFRPLVEQNTKNVALPTDLGLDLGQGQLAGMLDDLDPSKLAGDVQTLFSGCVV